MIDVETLSRLKAMRLSGMAGYFENLAGATGQNGKLAGPEMVKMAVDWEYERRRNSKLHRLRRHAALAQPGADVAGIKAMPGRSVDTELPPGHWHDRMEEKILADAIIDRITTNAHATVLTSSTDQRQRGGPPPAVRPTGAMAHPTPARRLIGTGTMAHHPTEQGLSPSAISIEHIDTRLRDDVGHG